MARPVFGERQANKAIRNFRFKLIRQFGREELYEAI